MNRSDIAFDVVFIIDEKVSRETLFPVFLLTRLGLQAVTVRQTA